MSNDPVVKLGETAGFLWGMIRNPELVWLNSDGSVAETERMSRKDRFEILRPHWTRTVLTTKSSCGCRKRLGFRYTIICLKHSRLEGRRGSV